MCHERMRKSIILKLTKDFRHKCRIKIQSLLTKKKNQMCLVCHSLDHYGREEIKNIQIIAV